MKTFSEKFDEFLAHGIGVSEKELKPELAFTEDLHLSLKDFVLLIMKLEAEFEVDLSDNDLENIRTVSNCKAVFKRLLSQKAGNVEMRKRG